jgi:hypothetical protein
MKRALAITTVGLALGAMLTFIAPSAMARDHVNWSLNIGAPFYSPPPVVYVEPQPVYVQPRRVYVRPQPVYVEPAYGSVYYVDGYRQPYYEQQHWDRRHHGHHRHDDHDRD